MRFLPDALIGKSATFSALTCISIVRVLVLASYRTSIVCVLPFSVVTGMPSGAAPRRSNRRAVLCFQQLSRLAPNLLLGQFVPRFGAILLCDVHYTSASYPAIWTLSRQGSVKTQAPSAERRPRRPKRPAQRENASSAKAGGHPLGTPTSRVAIASSGKMKRIESRAFKRTDSGASSQFFG